MSAQKSILSAFAWDHRYRVSGVEDVLTPALVVYPEFIASNIGRTLALLGGDADRWRVHSKTAKLGHTLRMLVERGVRNFKCATTLELLVACQRGAADVLLAYPSIGANARRVREIADQFPEVRISVLAENDEQILQWRGRPGRDGPPRARIPGLLDLDLGARVFELLFDRSRLVLVHAFFDRLGRAIHQVLGLLQT